MQIQQQPQGLDKAARCMLGGSFKIAIAAIVIGTIGIISSKIFGDDNPVEEAAEAVIEQTTGTKVDLSPNK